MLCAQVQYIHFLIFPSQQSDSSYSTLTSEIEAQRG